MFAIPRVRVQRVGQGTGRVYSCAWSSQGRWQIEADLMLLANLQLLCSFLLFRLQKENNER